MLISVRPLPAAKVSVSARVSQHTRVEVLSKQDTEAIAQEQSDDELEALISASARFQRVGDESA